MHGSAAGRLGQDYFTNTLAGGPGVEGRGGGDWGEGRGGRAAFGPDMRWTTHSGSRARATGQDVVDGCVWGVLGDKRCSL